MSVRRGDVLIVGLVLCLALFLLLITPGLITGAASSQKVFVIQTDTGIIRVEPGVDRQVTVMGTNGSAVIEVSGDRARIVESPCPHEAWHQGWISRPGEIKACLPNRVILKIEGSDNGLNLDGVTR